MANNAIIPYNKYINGKIYKITSCIDPSLIYVGSTCLSLGSRLAIHKCGYRRYISNVGTYIKAYDLFKLGKIKMELIPSCPSTFKNYLEKSRICLYIILSGLIKIILDLQKINRNITRIIIGIIIFCIDNIFN